MAAGLRAMGSRVEELPDGLRIQGGTLRGGAAIDAAMDHRIALAFSVAALAAQEPCTIEGAEWADVSFPGFYRLLRKLGAEVEILS
jgi:3-phosphoshikimate 1-carboxyvinyltransferase